MEIFRVIIDAMLHVRRMWLMRKHAVACLSLWADRQFLLIVKGVKSNLTILFIFLNGGVDIMTQTDKRLRNVLTEFHSGNPNLTMYSIIDDIPQISLRNKGILPSLFLFHWEHDDEVVLCGYQQCKPMDIQGNCHDFLVRAIFDERSSKKTALHVLSEDLNITYKSEINTSTPSKLIIFQDNTLFTDLVIFDTNTGIAPARLVSGLNRDRLAIRNLAFSYYKTLHGDIPVG